MMAVSYGPYLQGLAGNWTKFIFERAGMDVKPTTLILEIGCHQGLVLRKMAQDFPRVGFLGMDITFKRVIKTIRGAQSDGSKTLELFIAMRVQLMTSLLTKRLMELLSFSPTLGVKKNNKKTG